jgi:hypothetical protein
VRVLAVATVLVAVAVMYLAVVMPIPQAVLFLLVAQVMVRVLAVAGLVFLLMGLLLRELTVVQVVWAVAVVAVVKATDLSEAEPLVQVARF